MTRRIAISLGVTLIMLTTAAFTEADEPLRVAVITGGHGFEQEPFHAAFKSIKDITFREEVYPDAEKCFEADYRKDVDVYVYYDMNGTLSDTAKANMVAMLKEGKGLVAVHHCIASTPKWPEYTEIVGGRYFLAKETYLGKEWDVSTFKHDVWVDVTVVDKKHPVTKGLKDFRIYDEVYGKHWVSPKTTLLLATEHPESNGQLAWAHTYGRSRVVYIQLGHGTESYENPNFRKLLGNAIRWTSGWKEDGR